jgi:hypothetical protein
MPAARSGMMEQVKAATPLSSTRIEFAVDQAGAQLEVVTASTKSTSRCPYA